MSDSKTHHHEKKAHDIFICGECDKKYDNLEDLKKHKETHKDESLEKLKDEILGEVNKKGKKRLSWGSALISTILIVLTLISVTQTVQSANILNKINSGDFNSSESKSPSSAILPSSLENLPNMVGGC